MKSRRDILGKGALCTNPQVNAATMGWATRILVVQGG